MEEWRPITDFPDYEVSNQGNVRRGNKMLKFSKIGRRREYFAVVLYLNTERYCRRVHRLVGQAFIPNPENKPEIDHLDRNPANNIVSNLRWATSVENNNNRTNAVFHRNIYFRDGYYEVQIRRHGKIVYNKTFQILEEAIRGRDAFLIFT